MATSTNSRNLPDLPNKKDKTNWVEKAGGLPSYIERIAKHLHSEKGMTVSHAIATAVNTVKKWAAGKGGVSAATKAKAAKALAEWEAKKASAKATNASIRTDDDFVLHLAAQIEATSDDEFDMDAFNLALSVERAERGLPDEEDFGVEVEDFDYGQYLLSLNQERSVRGLSLSGVQERPLNLAIHFDPDAHPRDLKGRFKEIVGGLDVGGAVDLPDGTRVTNTGDGFSVVSPDHGKATKLKSADYAADKALAYSGASSNPKSVGGARSHPSADRAVKAHEKKHAESKTDAGRSVTATEIAKDGSLRSGFSNMEELSRELQDDGEFSLSDGISTTSGLSKDEVVQRLEAAPDSKFTIRQINNVRVPKAAEPVATHDTPDAAHAAAERLNSGEGVDGLDDDMRRAHAALPEGWEMNGRDVDHAEIYDPVNDATYQLENVDGTQWTVTSDADPEQTWSGGTAEEAVQKLSTYQQERAVGGSHQDALESSQVGGVIDISDHLDNDTHQAVETALDGQTSDGEDPEWDQEIDDLREAVRAGMISGDQETLLVDVLNDEIQASQDNLDNDGPDPEEKKHLDTLAKLRDLLEHGPDPTPDEIVGNG